MSIDVCSKDGNNECDLSLVGEGYIDARSKLAFTGRCLHKKIALNEARASEKMPRKPIPAKPLPRRVQVNRITGH